MDLIEIIKGRRSVRKYEDRKVPESSLDQILESVQWAPSWANTQCWELILVREAETRKALQQTLSKGNPSSKAMVQAPVILALCGKLEISGYYKGQITTKFRDWFMFDLGIATQNICLAAHDLGLGTVVVGLFDHNKAKRILEVPEGYELVAMIPLGYPADGISRPKRRNINEFVHQEKF